MSHDDLLGHYGSGVESGRLAAGAGRIERERTQAIVSRYLPGSPAVVYDIGGGPGTYAAWLLELGYSVHLVDPVPLHVEEASLALAGMAGEWSAIVGDARSLPFPDASADSVLLLGPLYHLTERIERIATLCEAYRVLRPGGFVFAAAISRFASLLDGMARNLLDDPDFRPIVERDLAEGRHDNPTNHPSYFTTAFFHQPEELQSEVEEAGFHLDKLCGVEGPTWILPDVSERWSNDARRKLWLELLERVEDEPALLGASAHFLAVGSRP